MVIVHFISFVLVWLYVYATPLLTSFLVRFCCLFCSPLLAKRKMPKTNFQKTKTQKLRQERKVRKFVSCEMFLYKHDFIRQSSLKQQPVDYVTIIYAFHSAV